MLEPGGKPVVKLTTPLMHCEVSHVGEYHQSHRSNNFIAKLLAVQASFKRHAPGVSHSASVSERSSLPPPAKHPFAAIQPFLVTKATPRHPSAPLPGPEGWRQPSVVQVRRVTQVADLWEGVFGIWFGMQFSLKFGYALNATDDKRFGLCGPHERHCQAGPACVAARPGNPYLSGAAAAKRAGASAPTLCIRLLVRAPTD